MGGGGGLHFFLAGFSLVSVNLVFFVEDTASKKERYLDQSRKLSCPKVMHGKFGLLFPGEKSEQP